MLRAEKLIRLQSFLVRHCAAASVPFQAPPCGDVNSTFNQSLRQWQFQLKLRNQTTRPTNPCRRRRPLVPITQTSRPHRMREYTLADLSGGCFAPPNERSIRITHEQRTALDRYAAKTRFGGTSDNRDPLVVDDRLHERLAAYMRDVMEQNSFYNKLYCIDFYNQYDRAGGISKSHPNYLDPEELARLLELLSLGIQLTPEQLAYLQEFLKQLAMLDPAEMAAFLSMFSKLGLLTPEVLMLFQKLMQDLNIDPKRLQALNALLGEALQKAVAIQKALAEIERAKRLGEDGFASKFNADKKTPMQVRPFRKPEFKVPPKELNQETKGDKDKDKVNKDKTKPGTEEPPKKVEPETKDTAEANVEEETEKKGKKGKKEEPSEPIPVPVKLDRGPREKVLAKPYKKAQVALPRKKVEAACGNACKGYYEPWDAELSWPDAQKLVARATAWRAMRIDWDEFTFIRGLEKYVAEIERNKPKPPPPKDDKKGGKKRK